jgi:MFS family permease
MRAKLRLHCLNLAYLFFGIVLFGATLSGLLTTDSRWMNWHFSRLGEGGMISAMIFNIALLISAVIMFALGVALTDNIACVSKKSDMNLDKFKKIINRSFTAIAICLVGVATFPFDRFPVVHNIFGYSMLFIFLGLCIVTPKMLPIFSRKFYIYGQSVILCTIICYVLFIIVGSITLLTVEFIIFTFLYGWLLLFINGILNNIPASEINSDNLSK